MDASITGALAVGPSSSQWKRTAVAATGDGAWGKVAASTDRGTRIAEGVSQVRSSQHRVESLVRQGDRPGCQLLQRGPHRDGADLLAHLLMVCRP